MTPVGLLLLALLPAVLGVLTAQGAAWVVRNVPPRIAATLLCAVALAVALACGVVLCLAALLGLAGVVPGWPPDWSPAEVYEQVPVPSAVGVVAAGAAATLLFRGVLQFCRFIVQMRRAEAAGRGVATTNGVAIMDDPACYAYAVPGSHAHVVVSRGLLGVLTPAQQPALLAHEQAHLRYRHYLYAQTVRLAAAANPLLKRIVPAVDDALERWADLAAARAIGSRHTVAHAVGAAALAGTGSTASMPRGVLAAAHGDVVGRVAALLAPTRTRTLPRVLLICALLTVILSAALVAWNVYSAVETAEAMFR